jgi:hypothetical protein
MIDIGNIRCRWEREFVCTATAPLNDNERLA